MLNEFEIKKIEDLKKQSFEQDELIFKLKKRLSRLERSILGYDLSVDDNGRGRC